jgi:M6 family metalloprotease-like protein
MPLRLKGRESLATRYFGKRVHVSGQFVANPSNATNAADQWAMIVDTIAPAPARSGDAAGAGVAVVGTRNVIFLLLAFSDDAAMPHAPSFYTDLTNPDTPPAGATFPATINGFFKRTSWNQLDWRGDVGGMGGVGAPGGWLSLPHPKSFYAPCGWGEICADIQAIAADGMALGRAQGIDFTQYDQINFVLSNDLDCCAWGGSYFSSIDNKSYGVTWQPPWGQETGTFSHEMGHSLGLPHSGWVYFAYDSPWDVMSNAHVAARSTTCGSYASKNGGGALQTLFCDEPGDGYIAAHKDYLGWIPPGNVVVTDTNSSVTVTLEADALPLSSAVKMVKICIAGAPCSGAAAHYFTLEARVQGLGTTSQYDNGITGDGIIIHEFQGDRPAAAGECFFSSSSGWAWPIDATPNDYDFVNCGSGGRTFPSYALFNAQWSPGSIYIDSRYGLNIGVTDRVGSAFVVSTRGTAVRHAGDFNGDGRADILWRHTLGTVYEWMLDGLNSTATGSPGSAGADWVVVGIGDFNGDGKSDILWRHTSGIVYVWLLDGTRVVGTGSPGNAGPDWAIVGVGDFNGDGKADILWRHASGNLYVWYLDGTSVIGTGSPGQAGNDWAVVGIGDFNGDGRADILWRHTSGSLYEWLLNGTAVVGTGSPGGAGNDWAVVGVGDFNADGRADILWRHTSGSLYEWLLNGTTVIAAGSPGGAGNDWAVVVVGDFNGDGKADILWRNLSGGLYEWLLSGASVVGTGSPGAAGTDWLVQ